MGDNSFLFWTVAILTAALSGVLAATVVMATAAAALI